MYVSTFLVDSEKTGCDRQPDRDESDYIMVPLVPFEVRNSRSRENALSFLTYFYVVREIISCAFSQKRNPKTTE